jgi:hypothetical protein
MNIPYLERLQNKPIPKTVKSFAINKKEQPKIKEPFKRKLGNHRIKYKSAKIAKIIGICHVENPSL